MADFTKGERKVVLNTAKLGYEVRIFNGEACLGTLSTFAKPGDALLDAAAPMQNEALQAVILDLENDGEVTMPTVDLIHKALAKAEGKEQ